MNRPHTLAEMIGILTRAFGNLETDILGGSELGELSLLQLRYLDLIHQMATPTISELARALQVSKPSVTVIVNKLAAGGFVEKHASDEDRRFLHVHLTEKGRYFNELHDGVHQSFAELFAEALSEEELQTLVRLMNKVVSGMNR